MATTTDLNERTEDELNELARERDIPGRSEMDKAQLVEALETDGDGDPRRARPAHYYQPLGVEKCHHLRADHFPGGP